ncbi:MAG: aminodeoxychorismate/anthranilate synthase component II [Candidatus Melainabacteria bacterium]
MTAAETPVVLIDNYDSFTYNLYQMVQALTTRVVKVFRNDAITFEELLALKPDRVILSPGPGHPANPRDFGVCREVITRFDALNCPVMGVCLGHQGIVQHLGGQVVQAPTIVHGKTSRVYIEADSPLFDGISNPFTAMRYHSLVISANNLPAEFTITATEHRDHLVMALQHNTKPIYGLQFHPESIGTPEGGRMLQNFIEKCHA